MREFFKNAIAAIVLSLAVMTGAAASDMKTVANATFKLYDGNDGACSVTFLHNDKEGALFLTAAHCVDGDNLNIRRQVLDQKNLSTVLSESVYYVKAVKTLTSKDIALLQTRDKSVSFSEASVDIASIEEGNKLSIGDNVIVVGYPAAEALSIKRGEFVGKVAQKFSGLDENALMYQATAEVVGGNSGGGLYAEIGGTWKLIGTVTGHRTDNGVMNYFQTIETVQEALVGYVAKTDDLPKIKSTDNLSVDER